MARALLVSLVLAAAFAAPAAADCPFNSVAAGCFDLVPTLMDTPSGDLEGHAWTAGTPCDGACFDLPHGAMHAANGWDISLGACASAVEMTDDYQLVGAAPGQAYPAKAILQVTVTIADPGTVHGRLVDMAHPEIVALASASSPGANQRFDVVLPITFTGGQPLRLNALLIAGGSSNTGTTGGSAAADAVLRFSGLPAGVGVISCRAYDLPVPAKSASWGAVKSLYR